MKIKEFIERHKQIIGQCCILMDLAPNWNDKWKDIDYTRFGSNADRCVNRDAAEPNYHRISGAIDDLRCLVQSDAVLVGYAYNSPEIYASEYDLHKKEFWIIAEDRGFKYSFKGSVYITTWSGPEISWRKVDAEKAVHKIKNTAVFCKDSATVYLDKDADNYHGYGRNSKRKLLGTVCVGQFYNDSNKITVRYKKRFLKYVREHMLDQIINKGKKIGSPTMSIPIEKLMDPSDIKILDAVPVKVEPISVGSYYSYFRVYLHSNRKKTIYVVNDWDGNVKKYYNAKQIIYCCKVAKEIEEEIKRGDGAIIDKFANLYGTIPIYVHAKSVVSKDVMADIESMVMTDLLLR